MDDIICQFKAPCGYCIRFDKQCQEIRGCNPNDPKMMRAVATTEEDADKKLLNPVGEYAAKFAQNHGISIKEALEQPMVRARRAFFNATGQ